MFLRKNALRDLFSGRRGGRAAATRRPRRVTLFGDLDLLEGRVTPAHLGAVHQLTAAFAGAHGGLGVGSGHGSGSSSNSTLTAALQTLRTEVQTIELASDTTVGQLAAIRAAFQTLHSDGLTPSSNSALTSFENSLVTAYASGTTLTGNTTLLDQFEALYTSSTSSLSSTQTSDLGTAYDALAAAVTSSNITSSDISTIDTDYAAVLSAEGSTSTATYPYFTLVTGGGLGGPGGPGGPGGMC